MRTMGRFGRCMRALCKYGMIVFIGIAIYPFLKSSGNGSLVLAHIPYNFGHTVEINGLLGTRRPLHAVMRAFALRGGPLREKSPSFLQPPRFVVDWVLRFMSVSGAEFWGLFYPGLDQISNVTGCSMYLSPQKHWPKDLADEYFSGRKVFGILRDPYERLVAQFRGSLGKNYGGDWGEFRKVCDVNGGIKKGLKGYISAKDPFAFGCTFLPQAEYFDQPFGIQVPIDTREFPDSMNKVFMEHGYSHFVIDTDDLLHVTGCNEKWAADFDNETRGLIKEIYARDFKLLCEHFGYCDDDELACLPLVPEMCPAARTKCRDKSGKPATYHYGKMGPLIGEVTCNATWEPGSSGPPS